MNNDKFVNLLMDTLRSNFNEAVYVNMTQQVNAKISEDIINELSEKVRILTDEKENLIKSIRDCQAKVSELNENNVKLELTDKEYIGKLEEKINDLSNKLSTSQSTAQHVETFREELKRSREENNQLMRQVDNLEKENAAIRNIVSTPVINKKSKKNQIGSDHDDGGTF